MTVYADGWLNEGTIAISNSSEATLGGTWRDGTDASITVVCSSTLALGSQIAIDPTSADAVNYVWSNAGSIAIANGATVYFRWRLHHRCLQQPLLPIRQRTVKPGQRQGAL